MQHIRTTTYSKRSNGIVERAHFPVREALMKLAHNEIGNWSEFLPFVLWADRGTVRRSLGVSPYFAAHGVEMVMPFDLEEATYLVEPPTGWMTTPELLAMRARQLQKRHEDLEKLRERVKDVSDFTMRQE